MASDVCQNVLMNLGISRLCNRHALVLSMFVQNIVEAVVNWLLYSSRKDYVV